jgi:hypothetical protein
MIAARSALAVALGFALGGAPGAPAAAELAAWDPLRVATLAAQLADATTYLYDQIWKQPEPTTPLGRRDYFRLRREVRQLKNEARELARDLNRGEGYEQTLPSYEDLASTARWARERARSVFTVKEVNEAAARVRELLNQLAPYYDPDAPAPK